MNKVEEVKIVREPDVVHAWGDGVYANGHTLHETLVNVEQALSRKLDSDPSESMAVYSSPAKPNALLAVMAISLFAAFLIRRRR